MIRSALMTVMTGAAIKAGRGLKRDFGEIGNLQVSMKGPGDFVSLADQRAEKIIFEELSRARPGYGFIMEEERRDRGRRQEPHLAYRSARRDDQFPARDPDIRHFDRAGARGPDRRRRDLQSGQ